MNKVLFFIYLFPAYIQAQHHKTLTLEEGTASKLSLKSVSSSSANLSSRSAICKHRSMQWESYLGRGVFCSNILKCTCSIKAILASLTSFTCFASSAWSRRLLSNIRPSSLKDPCFHRSFWLVTKSTTPKKFLPLPTGIYKSQVPKINICIYFIDLLTRSGELPAAGLDWPSASVLCFQPKD